jgi:hypothetical protein
MLYHIKRDAFHELVHKVGQLRAGPTRLHIALQHVEKLGQLVDGKLADKGPDPGLARAWSVVQPVISSPFTRMERNLYMVNTRLFRPTRFCLKITGPGEESRVRLDAKKHGPETAAPSGGSKRGYP